MPGDWLKKSASTLVLLTIWEVCARTRMIDPAFFPPPDTILLRLFELLALQPDFRWQVGVSVLRVLAAALIAIPAAILLALGIELSPLVSVIFRPLIAITYPIPKLALFPLLLLLFGLGEGSRISMISIGIFFLVLLNSLQGFARLREFDYHDLIRVFKIPRWKAIHSVLLRGALPEILTGVKMGMGYGLVMMVASEFAFSREGLGVFIWNSWDQFRIRDLYAGLVLISAMGLLSFGATDWLISRLPHRERNRSPEILD